MATTVDEGWGPLSSLPNSLRYREPVVHNLLISNYLTRAGPISDHLVKKSDSYRYSGTLRIGLDELFQELPGINSVGTALWLPVQDSPLLELVKDLANFRLGETGPTS